jgi:DNA-binding NarL/FixJ family response regulator
MEILVGIVRGERNATIAARLKLSTKSISTYRSRVLEKLGVDNNAQLVALATQAGLLQPN